MKLHSGNLSQFGRQITSINLGVWRKSEKYFFFQKKLYNKMCHDTKRIFQYIFFQNRPWGTPKAPENNFFFTLTEDR